MRTYESLVQLTRMSARQAWLSANPEVAALLWRMAKEYQAKAAEHSGAAELDIGDAPPWATTVTAEHRMPRIKSAQRRAA
jgi:hypothetical protein